MKGLLFLPLLAGCQPEFAFTGEVIEYVEVEVEVETVDTDEHPANIVEGFVQIEGLQELDILVFVDRSGSMNVYETKLYSGMTQLWADVETVTTEWSMTFSATDPYALVTEGPYTHVDSDIDMLVGLIGMSKPGGEEGFDAMVEYCGVNPDCLDDDTLIIFISDEEEQSTITAAEFKSFLDSTALKQYDVISIVGNGVDCATHGGEYIELVNLLGKTHVDLCSDWTAALVDFSILFGLIDTWELMYEPVVSTIQVFDEWQPYPHWTFDSSMNQLLFTVPPDEGSPVTIAYDSWIP